MPGLVFLFLCLIWGFSWVAIKLTLEGLPPFPGAGFRFLIAVPCLAAYALAAGVPRRVPREAYAIVVLTAIISYGLDYGLIYWAEQFLSAGSTAIFFATFPFFTALFSHFIFRSEAASLRVYLGLLIGFSGVLLAFYGELAVTPADGYVGWAILAVIAAACSGGLSTVLVKTYLQGIHPVTLGLHSMGWGASVLLLAGWLRGEMGSIVWTSEAVFGLLYLGIGASALAFSLFYWLLHRMGAITVSSTIYVTPIVAVVTDNIVYGQWVSINTIGGMGLIFCGIAVTELPRYRRVFQWRPG